MLLVQLFNETLNRIPKTLDGVRQMVFNQDWSQSEKNQAIALINQVINQVCKNKVEINYQLVTIPALSLILAPHMCGISGESFSEENIEQGTEYILNLLHKLNELTDEVTFSYGGHFYKPGKTSCKFTIHWTF